MSLSNNLLGYYYPKLSIYSKFMILYIEIFQSEKPKLIFCVVDIGKYLNNFTAIIITTYDNNSNWIKIIINNLLPRKNSELNKIY